jgi:hypothetical protein
MADTRDTPDASVAPAPDINAQARAIIETAIRDLVALGMERESAAHLLAVQGSIRMVNRAALRTLVRMIVDDHAL